MGLCVIPLSILVGTAKMVYQDRYLMTYLLTNGVLGMSLLNHLSVIIILPNLSSCAPMDSTGGQRLFYRLFYRI
jgi:hypothetical protein